MRSRLRARDRPLGHGSLAAGGTTVAQRCTRCSREPATRKFSTSFKLVVVPSLFNVIVGDRCHVLLVLVLAAAANNKLLLLTASYCCLLLVLTVTTIRSR